MNGFAPRSASGRRANNPELDFLGQGTRVELNCTGIENTQELCGAIDLFQSIRVGLRAKLLRINDNRSDTNGSLPKVTWIATWRSKWLDIIAFLVPG